MIGGGLRARKIGCGGKDGDGRLGGGVAEIPDPVGENHLEGQRGETV